MPRLSFHTALLLAPLAYVIHHGEEHLLFNFREWRLRYFLDNNALPTEAVLAILVGVMLVYILLDAFARNRVSASMAVLFLMSAQVHNAIFHAGGTIVFRDFSPGLITALLLYIPVNVIIMRAALAEKLVSKRMLALLFVLGGVLFWSFEFFGPATLLIATLVPWICIAVSMRGGRPAVA